VNWLGDVDDDHGEAWGRRKGVRHYHNGDSWGNFGDQDNGDADGDSGNTGSTGSGDPSTPNVPEPSVLVLLSTALAAFSLLSQVFEESYGLICIQLLQRQGELSPALKETVARCICCASVVGPAGVRGCVA